jgi:hypothetical protein
MSGDFLAKNQRSDHRRLIRPWLYAVAAMVLVGGATRLTESGLIPDHAHVAQFL